MTFITDQNNSEIPLYLDVHLTITTPNCGDAYGTAHAFVTKDGPPTQQRIIIYPNPASEELTVVMHDEEKGGENKESSAFSVQLFNDKGQILKEAASRGLSATLDVRNIMEGTYYLHVRLGKKLIRKQVIIKHD